ncbi:hypothetical protein Mapa_002743 [Marchantia paleacea]|nr:hypothetical protein Mapa_002743 [Marchantia paleacea]
MTSPNSLTFTYFSVAYQALAERFAWPTSLTSISFAAGGIAKANAVRMPLSSSGQSFRMSASIKTLTTVDGGMRWVGRLPSRGQACCVDSTCLMNSPTKASPSAESLPKQAWADPGLGSKGHRICTVNLPLELKFRIDKSLTLLLPGKDASNSICCTGRATVKRPKAAIAIIPSPKPSPNLTLLQELTINDPNYESVNKFLFLCTTTASGSPSSTSMIVQDSSL